MPRIFAGCLWLSIVGKAILTGTHLTGRSYRDLQHSAPTPLLMELSLV